MPLSGTRLEFHLPVVIRKSVLAVAAFDVGPDPTPRRNYDDIRIITSFVDHLHLHVLSRSWTIQPGQFKALAAVTTVFHDGKANRKVFAQGSRLIVRAQVRVASIAART